MEGADPVSFQERAGVAPRFDAFVNWDYRHRQKLRGWKNTTQLIALTLAEWYPDDAAKGKVIENGSAAALRTFLSELPAAGGASGDAEAPFQLVYLGAHQSPAGEWDFTNKEKIRWGKLVDGISISSPARRIVILDSCFAESVPEGWGSRLAEMTLYSSSSSEPTIELNVNRRIPVYYKRDYPRAVAWLEARFGKKWMRGDSRLSFVGFVWLQAFLHTESPPRTSADWEQFLRRCQTEAASFRRESSARLASTVRMAKG